MNPRAKDVILSLLEKVLEEKKKCTELQKRQDELKTKLRLMKSFFVGVVICILMFVLVPLVN
jgi:uncharacterized membrane protein